MCGIADSQRRTSCAVAVQAGQLSEEHLFRKNGTNGISGICPGCRLLPLKVPLTGEANSLRGAPTPSCMHSIMRERDGW